MNYKQTLKIIGSNLSSGFLLGLGLFIGISIASFLYYSYIDEHIELDKKTESKETVQKNKKSTYEDFRLYKDSGVEIISHRKRDVENGVIFVGEIENKSDSTWTSIEIEAELFDEAGVFVDSCSTYTNGKLMPEEIIHFKLKCGNCKNIYFPVFDSYKLNVVDGLDVAYSKR